MLLMMMVIWNCHLHPNHNHYYYYYYCYHHHYHNLNITKLLFSVLYYIWPLSSTNSSTSVHHLSNRFITPTTTSAIAISDKRSKYPSTKTKTSLSSSGLRKSCSLSFWTLMMTLVMMMMSLLLLIYLPIVLSQPLSLSSLLLSSRSPSSTSSILIATTTTVTPNTVIQKLDKNDQSSFSSSFFSVSSASYFHLYNHLCNQSLNIYNNRLHHFHFLHSRDSPSHIRSPSPAHNNTRRLRTTQYGDTTYNNNSNNKDVLRQQTFMDHSIIMTNDSRKKRSSFLFGRKRANKAVSSSSSLPGLININNNSNTILVPTTHYFLESWNANPNYWIPDRYHENTVCLLAMFSGIIRVRPANATYRGATFKVSPEDSLGRRANCERNSRNMFWKFSQFDERKLNLNFGDDDDDEEEEDEEDEEEEKKKDKEDEERKRKVEVEVIREVGVDDDGDLKMKLKEDENLPTLMATPVTDSSSTAITFSSFSFSSPNIKSKSKSKKQKSKPRLVLVERSNRMLSAGFHVVGSVIEFHIAYIECLQQADKNVFTNRYRIYEDARCVNLSVSFDLGTFGDRYAYECNYIWGMYLETTSTIITSTYY